MQCRTMMATVLVVALVACDASVPNGVPPTAPTLSRGDDGRDAHAGESYSVRVLPALPEGRWATAIAINNQGVVIGVGDVNSRLGCRDFSAAIAWIGGSMRNLHAELAALLDIGLRPPWPTCAELGTMPLDLNDQGDVIVFGSIYGDNTSWIWNAQKGFRDGGYGGRLGGAVSINNRGEMVGYVDEGFTRGFAALWSSGTLQNIDPAEFGSVAFDISDDGHIVGCVGGRLARWRVGGKATVLSEVCGEDLGVVPGVLSRPIGGVARDGVAALSAMRNGVPTPLIWRGARVTEAGWGPGSASGISDRGRLVGWGYRDAQRVPRAVTRLRDGAVEWLPTPTGTTTSRAYGVNSCGDVVGYVIDPRGLQRGAVWTRGSCDAARKRPSRD